MSIIQERLLVVGNRSGRVPNFALFLCLRISWQKYVGSESYLVAIPARDACCD